MTLEWRRDDKGRASTPTGVAIQGDPAGIGLFGPPAVVAHANRATHTVHQPRRGRILDGHAERHATSVPPQSAHTAGPWGDEG